MRQPFSTGCDMQGEHMDELPLPPQASAGPLLVLCSAAQCCQLKVHSSPKRLVLIPGNQLHKDDCGLQIMSAISLRLSPYLHPSETTFTQAT